MQLYTEAPIDTTILDNDRFSMTFVFLRHKIKSLQPLAFWSWFPAILVVVSNTVFLHACWHLKKTLLRNPTPGYKAPSLWGRFHHKLFHHQVESVDIP